MSRSRLLISALLTLALAAVPGVALARHSSHHKRHHRHTHSASQTQPTGESVEIRNSTVVSFDPTTGKLTLTLPGNQSVSGNVTDTTRIECEAANENGEHGNGKEGRRMARHGSDENGDQGGQGGEQNDNDADDQNPQPQCSSSDLTPGAQVAEAELDSNDNFTKLEVVK